MRTQTMKSDKLLLFVKRNREVLQKQTIQQSLFTSTVSKKEKLHDSCSLPQLLCHKVHIDTEASPTSANLIPFPIHAVQEILSSTSNREL